MAKTSMVKPTTKIFQPSSFSEYLALKLAYEKAQKENSLYVVFKNQTIPLSTAQAFLKDGKVFFEKAPQTKNTPLEAIPQKPPTETKPLEKFLQENQSTIKAYEARNQLSTQIGIKTATILKQSKNPEMVDFLQKSAYNYLIQNPNASKENIVSWLLGVTSQKTPLKNASKNKVPPKEIDQIVDEQMWLENQKVIKETLGGAPLISTPTNPSSAIKSQIASTIKAQNPDMPDQKANSMAAHIEQAMQSVGATSSPANTRGFDSATHAKAIKQILVENGHLDAASQVDPLKELVRLGIISTHEEAVHLFKPTNAPTAGVNFSTPQGKTVFNNARVVNTNSQSSEGGQTHPLTTTSRILEHHYQTQIPQGQTVFRYIWNQIFGGGTPITQPNFLSYVNQIRGARSFLPTNSSGFTLSDLKNTVKLFSNADGLGVKGLFSKGFSGLKSLFGFGKSAGTLAGTGAKTAAAVNATGAAVVGSGSTIAALPYIAAALLVLGFFIFLTTNRGNLDTTAEVRSNYGTGAGGGQAEEQSKYARLIKTASITKLEDPTGKITYTYTVTPLLGPITITSFSDTTTIFQESGQRDLALDLQPEEPPTDLSAAFTSKEFSLTLKADMDDAIITNTAEITFINPEGQTETISGSASTIIGTPPTGCYIFAEPPASNSGIGAISWSLSPESVDKETSAIAAIFAAFGGQNTVLCNGPINLYLAKSGLDVDYGGWHFSPGNIALDFKLGSVGSPGNAIYTLAHESGHVYDSRSGISGGAFRQAGFVTWNGSECLGNIYPFAEAYIDTAAECYGENFAEGFAKYITGSLSSSWKTWFSANVFK